ncbi:MAG TPA: 4Fe-4S dicluster domain-containing protein [Steroidobacteraceae bacterium]|nr:4Fe-4S dicluster domain-containing protein [Steroidobacteraceae bacterium]
MLDLPPLMDRREFMKLMSAALALAAGGCAHPPLEPIVPYVDGRDEGATQGDPLYFATALTQGGYAQGVLARSDRGRPTKIEGNPQHPASLGASSPIEQGRILELWDPKRSHAVLHDGEIASWDELMTLLSLRLERLRPSGGAGLRLLTLSSSSLTEGSVMDAALARYPQARRHRYEPINQDNVHEGARLAFGRWLEPVYHFDRALTILSLEADFLGCMPGRVRYARDYIQLRRPDAKSPMSRLYVVECMPSLTGAAADSRLASPSSRIGDLAAELAERLASGGKTSSAWLETAATDLQSHRGRSLVLAGEGQPPEVHALAHRMNDMLGNIGRTVDFIQPPIEVRELAGDSLAALVADMHAGRVDTLLILGGNPVYDAPADLEFDRALERVPASIHFGLLVDETAGRCAWHVPAAHELETWGDAKAFDGTLTIRQPLIAPLYGGKSALELLGLLTGQLGFTSHDLVHATWLARFGQERFDERWREALRGGVVPHTATPFEAAEHLGKAGAPAAQPPTPGAPPIAAGETLEIVFRPDPYLWDGRYAQVAWLQELPRPLTDLTWDNAALMSPTLAARLGVRNEQIVELELGGRTVEAPVWIVAGHADGAVTLPLGWGRTAAGEVGSAHGANAYALRTSKAPWFARGLRVTPTARERTLASVHDHHRMLGRDIVRSATVAAYRAKPDFARKEADLAPPPTLYPDYSYPGHAWGMSIDLTSCIGCSACTIACQAENNIPTVGKEQVLMGREMHWIRVDRYDEGPVTAPRSAFQPVPCMQCEHAPCETVCPVEASVHDTEGINVQVYNRCVGTRFCANNCPYKVRRFNFLRYAEDTPSLDAMRNPDVTVRMRGVMEKCNYCLQRIVRARIVADRENRDLHDGEVLTACQAVCPTRAIVFGDLNDPHSQVRIAKSSPRNYALLGDLDTRPRTTYLARIVNTTEEEPG